MARLLRGKEVVASLGEGICESVDALRASGVVPTLAIVRVGARPDDLSYERTALKRAESLGIEVKTYELDEHISGESLKEVLCEVNDNPNIHGCLLFRPLPESVDESALCNVLMPEKDIDGISLASLASVFTDGEAGFPPCTAAACLAVLDHYNIPVAGKHVVVIGRSLVIGKPVAMMLLSRNASVTICHSKTENLADITKAADIVICATGRARAFDAQFFALGQTVLDVGINFDEAGVLCGDVDFDSVEPIVGAITPVPGGIGSVTTSITMEHVVSAAARALGCALETEAEIEL